MKRHQKHFKILSMLDDFARSEGMSINDEIVIDKFIQRLSDTVKKHRNNSIRIYGFRVESMFAHIVAALGNTQIITEEDSGVFFSSDENIRRPDFRLITIDGKQLLIEVKNFHQKDPEDPFIIKPSYLLTLKKYAGSFNVPLKFAIFWSRWEIWTLVDADQFFSEGSDFYISVFEAMKRNEMNLIGDSMIGTVPPLSLRIYADKNKPRSVDKNGHVHFTIGKVAFIAGGQEISDEFEKGLVWFFMLHGKWEKVDQPAKVTNGLLEYTEFSVSPEIYEEQQGFAMIGYLSQLITSNYKFLTSPEGEVLQLTPKQQPDQLGVLIPKDFDFACSGLKLWRFDLQPNYEELIMSKKKR